MKKDTLTDSILPWKRGWGKPRIVKVCTAHQYGGISAIYSWKLYRAFLWNGVEMLLLFAFSVIIQYKGIN